MATDQPLEEINIEHQEDDGGEEYNPIEAEKSKHQSSTNDQQKESDNKNRETRSRSPISSIGDSAKTGKKEIECKVFLLNGDVITITVDVSLIIFCSVIYCCFDLYVCVA